MNLNVYKGLTSKQKSILKSIRTSNYKYNVIRASRQAGKSVLLTHAAVLLAFEKKNQLGAIICPSHSQARNLYRRLIKKLPNQLVLSTTNSDADRKIELINGTIIHFFSSKYPDNIRGYSFDFLVLDEFSYINEDAWNSAINPTIAAKRHAKVIAASTPCGYNLFHTWCSNGLDSNNKRYNHYFFHYTDNPFYDIEEVEEKKKELPTEIFNQEYEAKFIKGSSTVFGNFDAYQILKSYPLYDPTLKYYFGIDWSGTGSDDTVLTIINNEGEIVFIKEFDNDRINDKALDIAGIINEFKGVGYSEVNGLGLGATEIVQFNTERCYRFNMSNDSKQQIVTELIKSLGTGIIKLPTLSLCSKLDNQMSTYQVSRTATGKLKYEHMKNGKDDYVDSLLMANSARINLSGTGTVDVYSPDDNDYDNNYDFDYAV